MFSLTPFVVWYNAHQSDSTYSPGGVTHLDRMATMRAQGFPKDVRDRQGTAVDRGGHGRGHLVHLGPVGRSGPWDPDEDRRALCGPGENLSQGDPSRRIFPQTVHRATVGCTRRIIPQSGHPNRRRPWLW